MSPAPLNPWPDRWQRFSATSLRAFHAYAHWLVGISWRRFILLSLLLLVLTALLKDIPPFSWRYTRTISHPAELAELPAEVAVPPASNSRSTGDDKPAQPPVRPDKPGGVDITIDERGVRIAPRAKGAASVASAASAAGGAASPPAPIVDIRLPAGPVGDGVRQAVQEARQAIDQAVREAQAEAEAARAEAEAARTEGREVARQAAREARRAVAEIKRSRSSREVHVVGVGDFLPNLALLWIVGSLIIKITYKRQIQAEAQAAQAVETAGAESLRRQVVEARMAAMQAQVEPHFLFNTLASIDHLIEVDPRRASLMQKNLIALLRASMPTMRETGSHGAPGVNGGRARDLGRELEVTRPYLEILKVRMEERLSTEIDVPEGLLSAEFPPMMVQTLVENAIKHGLEPKPEGGRLSIRAEIVHGKLALTVADTGLGFGRAATAGTGVGLANIRERLQLLYGGRASLTITENPGGGTRVRISLPYKPVEGTVP